MTADDHRIIGRILGIPECCRETWIASLPFDPPMPRRPIRF